MTVEALRDYPYQEGERGIDFKTAFEEMEEDGKMYLGEQRGGSGRPLLVKVTGGLIWVTDRANEDLRLVAKLTPEKEVEFDIRTLGFEGSRHPDMYAARFVALALRRFGDVRAIRSVWPKKIGGPESSNYLQYAQLRAEGLGAKQAALGTWCGRVFSENGFGEVVEVDEERDMDQILVGIRTVFSKK